MDRLIKALLDGDQTIAATETRGLLEQGIEREQIVTDAIEVAMEHLNAKCTLEQFNLLEIMLAGRAVTAIIKELYPSGTPPARSKGTVVIASLEGDVHDLGKTIVKMALTAKAYRVVDCGKDCPVDRFVETAEREGALAAAVSGLITTVIPEVRQIRDKMKDLGLSHIKIIIGGAALKQSSPESLNVDFVGQTAFDGVRYLEELVRNLP
jgi:methanogenic corrinoid protein MtbC1